MYVGWWALKKIKIYLIYIFKSTVQQRLFAMPK